MIGHVFSVFIVSVLLLSIALLCLLIADDAKDRRTRCK